MPPWSLFSKVATWCLAASAYASRSTSPPWEPKCGRARRALTVAQHRGPGNSLEAAVCSKRVPFGRRGAQPGDEEYGEGPQSTFSQAAARCRYFSS
eukprot:5253568-Pyramimonas_sp.AAC.1